VTSDLRSRGVRAVLLDIEGTTTPIVFVTDVLFPYARARLASHLRDHWRDEPTRRVVSQLGEEHAADRQAGQAPPVWPDRGSDVTAVAAYAIWLMDRDRKSPGLKELQGQIWEAGYQDGVLRGLVFADVAPAIRRWHAAGLRVAIYSSGSEQAQRRLFESTPAGDLTALLDAFFDTRVGAKVDAASYTRIAASLSLAPAAVLFVSDVTAELQAARAAGMAVALAVRPGNPPQPAADEFHSVGSFDELVTLS
jgi:enolase-phosphatase E1